MSRNNTQSRDNIGGRQIAQLKRDEPTGLKGRMPNTRPDKLGEVTEVRKEATDSRHDTRPAKMSAAVTEVTQPSMIFLQSTG